MIRLKASRSADNTLISKGWWEECHCEPGVIWKFGRRGARGRLPHQIKIRPPHQRAFIFSANRYSARVLRTLRKAEYAELMILFFIQAAGMAVWFVPLGSILDTHGLHHIKPFAFATNAIASFVSPLIFGAMADRHVPPAIVLRWLAL